MSSAYALPPSGPRKLDLRDKNSGSYQVIDIVNSDDINVSIQRYY